MSALRLQEEHVPDRALGDVYVCVCVPHRALGDIDYKEPKPLISAEPDVVHWPLQRHADEFVIYATDGVWAVLSDQEAVECVKAALRQVRVCVCVCVCVWVCGHVHRFLRRTATMQCRVYTVFFSLNHTRVL